MGSIHVASPFRHPEMTPAYGAQSLLDSENQSVTVSNVDSTYRPEMSMSAKRFPRAVKRKVSRDPIASDSDTRNIQALSDFLRDRAPPPTSFTSTPEEEEPPKTTLFGLLGGRSRRNSSSWSMRSVKRKSNSQSITSSRKVIQLPDSAVAMRTGNGKHWHIAICIPGVHDVPPVPALPRTDATNFSHVKASIPPGKAPEVIPSTSVIESNQSPSKRMSTPLRQSYLAKAEPELESGSGDIEDLRKALAQVAPGLKELPQSGQPPPTLSANDFQNQKHKIAAAIASWDASSYPFDLSSFLRTLASMAVTDIGAASTTSEDVDPETDLWRNRAMSVSTDMSGGLRSHRDSTVGTMTGHEIPYRAPSVRSMRTVTKENILNREPSMRTVKKEKLRDRKASVRTVKMEKFPQLETLPTLPVMESSSWEIGELVMPERYSPPIIARRTSIDTIRTQRTLRKERVSAMRKRDVQAMKLSEVRGGRPRFHEADDLLAVEDSAGLWQPAHVAAHVASQVPETSSPQPQPSSAIKQILEPIVRAAPGHTQDKSRFDAEDSAPALQPAPLARSVSQAPLPQLQQLDLLGRGSETIEHPGEEFTWSRAYPAGDVVAQSNPRVQDDRSIAEITKSLMLLQQQNAYLMQTIGSLANMGSSYQDMRSLAEPTAAPQLWRRSTLIDV